MRYIIQTILLFWLAGSSGFVFGQAVDTIHPLQNEPLENQLENMAENTDFKLDYTDLTGDYLYYAKHPVNINGSKIRTLVELHLINEFQLTAIKNYILQNGPILSKYELAYIPSMTPNTLKRLSPFIQAGVPAKTADLSIKKALKYGQQQLIFRETHPFERSLAYQTPRDSAFKRPGSIYLGNPEKAYIRYGFNASNRLRLGVTAEKDAGEIMPFIKLNDSVMKLLNNKRPAFPDFVSAYVYVSDFGLLKKAIIGDYHLEFGQGLTLWSGLTFGKSAQACNIKYYGRGIRPSTSVNENRFFRGAAATLGNQNIACTFFYSNHKIDGNRIVSDSLENQSISSLPESGNHRTINELNNKKALQCTLIGAHLSVTHQNLGVGITYYHSLFKPPLLAGDKAYQQFYFQGNTMQNAGVDFTYSFQKLLIFGELSGNGFHNVSGITGFNAYLNDRLQLSLLYRNLSKSYHVLYASPFMVNSRPNNEQGIYLGCVALVASHVQFSAYADYYFFPWLKYRVDAPSMGKAYLAQVQYTNSSNLSLIVRFRYREKQENSGGLYDYTDHIITNPTYSFRLSVSYPVSEPFILKNRLEYVNVRLAGNQQKGMLFYQDVLYRPSSFPLEFSFRYALFDTDGWESRIYAYENDVLYAFSIPSYYGKGSRMYLLLRWKPAKNMNLWMRLARTTWFDRNKIGSGADLIAGNHKTEIKIEWMVRF